MASYDENCFNTRFEDWVRHHVASSNTLLLAAHSRITLSLDAEVKEFLRQIQIEPVRIVGVSERRSESLCLDDDFQDDPSAYDTAKREFNRLAERFSVITDFNEIPINYHQYVMSGTGVYIPDSLYETH